jgi:hypothetical protein
VDAERISSRYDCVPGGRVKDAEIEVEEEEMKVDSACSDDRDAILSNFSGFCTFPEFLDNS